MIDTIYCRNCYCKISADSKFCPECGSRIEWDEPGDYSEPTRGSYGTYEDPDAKTGLLSEADAPKTVPGTETAKPAGGTMEYKAFYNAYASKNSKSWVITTGVVALLSAAASIGFLAMGLKAAIIDIVLFGGFGSALLATKKSEFSAMILVFAIIGIIIAVVNSGQITGIFALVCAIFSTVRLSKVDTAYTKYKKEGIRPSAPI